MVEKKNWDGWKQQKHLTWDNKIFMTSSNRKIKLSEIKTSFLSMINKKQKNAKAH